MRRGILRRILFLLISLLYLGVRSFILSLRRLSVRSTSGSCIVLYYHSIPFDCRQRFARQLEILRKLGHPLNLASPPSLIPGERYVAVTFDDVFEDAIANAVPELVKREIPAVFFVTTAYIGDFAGWWPSDQAERNRRIASLEELRELPANLISLGAHTLTHPRLSQLTKPDARREISESGHILQALLGREVDTFSFPYGDFNEELVELCREAGYKRVFTSEHREAHVRPTDFVVGRVKAEPTDWNIEFRLKVLGGYLWVPWASAIKRLCFGDKDYSGRVRRSCGVESGL